MRELFLFLIVVLVSVVEAQRGYQKQDNPIRWEATYVYNTNVEMELCYFTECEEEEPRCSPGGWVELLTDTTECTLLGHSRKYCCKEGKLPRCLYTPCSSKVPECPLNYRQMDVDEESCGGRMWNAYCCRNDYYPKCFNTSCALASRQRKCPKGYFTAERMIGVREGCSGDKVKLQCCAISDQQLRSKEFLPSVSSDEPEFIRSNTVQEPSRIVSSGSSIEVSTTTLFASAIIMSLWKLA